MKAKFKIKLLPKAIYGFQFFKFQCQCHFYSNFANFMLYGDNKLEYAKNITITW